MRFQRVRDVLEQTCRFHHALAERYDTLRDGLPKAKVGMLLAYLGDHERKLETAVRHLSEDTAARVLDTWLDGAPEAHLPEIPADISAHIADADIMDVVHLAIRFHDELIAIYQALADRAPNGAIADIFTGLQSLENHEKLRMVRDAVYFQDT